MDSLNLEDVFGRVIGFLNENRLRGSWDAKKDDVLQIVIIHRSDVDPPLQDIVKEEVDAGNRAENAVINAAEDDVVFDEKLDSSPISGSKRNRFDGIHGRYFEGKNVLNDERFDALDGGRIDYFPAGGALESSPLPPPPWIECFDDGEETKVFSADVGASYFESEPAVFSEINGDDVRDDVVGDMDDDDDGDDGDNNDDDDDSRAATSASFVKTRTGRVSIPLRPELTKSTKKALNEWTRKRKGKGDPKPDPKKKTKAERKDPTWTPENIEKKMEKKSSKNVPKKKEENTEKKQKELENGLTRNSAVAAVGYHIVYVNSVTTSGLTRKGTRTRTRTGEIRGRNDAKLGDGNGLGLGYVENDARMGPGEKRVGDVKNVEDVKDRCVLNGSVEDGSVAHGSVEDGSVNGGCIEEESGKELAVRRRPGRPKKVIKSSSGRPCIVPELKRNQEGVIKCPICGRTFTDSKKALTHYRKAHKKYVFPCEKCPREFVFPKCLKIHEDTVHNDGEGQLICQRCGMRFHHVVSIKQHVKRRHSDDDDERRRDRTVDDDEDGDEVAALERARYKCSVGDCEATFYRLVDKQAHLFAAHPESIIYCRVCKRPFTSERTLYIHLKTTHENGPLHKCKYCEKDFALEESLLYHCDEEHEDEDVNTRNFICPVSNCLKRFTSQANVETHSNVHKAWVTRKANRLKGITSRPPPKKAGKKKKMKPKSSSGNSKEIDDDDDDNDDEDDNTDNRKADALKSPCEVCGKLMEPGNKMKKHIRDNHLLEQKHKCNECGRVFERKDRLRNHRLIAHVKRELKCVICHKIYYSRKVLAAHVKGVHDKVRHPCSMCDRSYSQRADLLVHIKGVHEGRRSLCSVCGKEFVRASEKNRHERQVHNLYKEPINERRQRESMPHPTLSTVRSPERPAVQPPTLDHPPLPTIPPPPPPPLAQDSIGFAFVMPSLPFPYQNGV